MRITLIALAALSFGALVAEVLKYGVEDDEQVEMMRQMTPQKLAYLQASAISGVVFLTAAVGLPCPLTPNARVPSRRNTRATRSSHTFGSGLSVGDCSKRLVLVIGLFGWMFRLFRRTRQMKNETECPFSGETDICESCRKQHPMEHSVSCGGGVYLCSGCHTQWMEEFNSCAHDWENCEFEGLAGRVCNKCGGFVENAE